MTDRHNHPPDAFDSSLADLSVHVEPGNPNVGVTVAVPVTPTTLAALTDRAAREGRDVGAVIAEALQAAAAY
jgi:hypothetical protein